MAMSTSPEHGSIATCPSCRQGNRIPTVASGVPRCAQCHRSLPSLADADDDSFADAVTGPLAVLVELWAPWCMPCRLVGPVVEQSASEFAGRLKVVRVNVDDAPAVAQRPDVLSVPTLVAVYHGREVARRVGALPAAVLGGWLEGALPVAA